MRLAPHLLVGALTVLAACASRPRTARPPSPAATLSLDGRRAIEIYIPPDAMADDVQVPPEPAARYRAEDDRRRLRESVRDLARVLGAITSAKVAVSTSPPAVDDNASYRILLGRFAADRFGPVGVSATLGQGFRVVVGTNATGLWGENALGTSYAIYELLDRAGCRWFFPSPLGEVLPDRFEVALGDEARTPSTDYRGVWYADADWKRRNREGGLTIQAGHALELAWVTPADRVAHPDWRATIQGHPDSHRLRWSSASMAEHVAAQIVARARQDGEPSYSISPDDGDEFDDSPEDRALDTGDFDPTSGKTALADRFVHFANHVAASVARTDPDLLLGFLAYVQYTRPPTRERLAPSLVPMIAPITYARAHPMDDDRAPDSADLRRAISRWGELSRHGTSVYFYGYFLAEPVAPNPMLTKWGHDVPFVLAHGARYWQPETLPTFESTLHSLWLGMRLAFDARLKPEDVYADLDARLYGAAGPAMHAYWHAVDRTWIDTPEYSGGVAGQLRRFPPERLAGLRRLLDAAKAAARTGVERRRVELADDSLSLFEEVMRLRRDFAEGNFTDLAEGGESYKKHASALGEKWRDAYAFAKTSWAPEGVYARYFDAFEAVSFVPATRIARAGGIQQVLRRFRWTAIPRGNAGLSPAVAPTAAWRATDVTRDSWSALGLHDWFGGVWYRTDIVVAHRSAKRVYLWLSRVDGAVRVFVDGKEAPYAPQPGSPPGPLTTGGPLRFDVTDLVSGAPQALAIRTDRTSLTELGVSGLMGPVVIYNEP